MQLAKGVRVTFVRDVYLADTVVRKGESGTVVYVNTEPHRSYVDVRLVKFHKGLVQWDNVVHLIEPELSALLCPKAKLLETIAALAALICGALT